MPIPASNSHEVQAAVAAIVAACACVLYWRTAIRLILVLVVAAAVFGVAGVASFIDAHHL